MEKAKVYSTIIKNTKVEVHMVGINFTKRKTTRKFEMARLRVMVDIAGVQFFVNDIVVFEGKEDKNLYCKFPHAPQRNMTLFGPFTSEFKQFLHESVIDFYKEKAEVFVEKLKGDLHETKN